MHTKAKVMLSKSPVEGDFSTNINMVLASKKAWPDDFFTGHRQGSDFFCAARQGSSKDCASKMLQSTPGSIPEELTSTRARG